MKQVIVGIVIATGVMAVLFQAGQMFDVAQAFLVWGIWMAAAYLLAKSTNGPD